MGQKVVVGGVTRTIKGTTKATKGAPRSKRPGANNSQCRQRYWASGILMKRKIKNLMRFCGYTRAEATNLWLSTRGTSHRRIKTMVIPA